MKTTNHLSNAIFTLILMVCFTSFSNSQTSQLKAHKTHGSADLMITCPINQTEAACQTQAVIDSKFASWLVTAAFSGGCDVSLSNNAGVAPASCGGITTVTFTATSSCDPPVSCSATFSVTNAPPVTLNCASNQTEASCQSQSSIDTKFATWLSTATFTGGCNASMSNNNSGAPDKCGGSATIQFTVTSTCTPPLTCNSIFTVIEASPITLICPPNKEEATGQTQAQIDVKFNQWLIIAGFTGGCQASLSNDNSGAPPHTGGSTTVTWTVASACEANVTCSAVFTVKDPTSSKEEQIFEKTILSINHYQKQALLQLQFDKPQLCNIQIINANGQMQWHKSINTIEKNVIIDYKEFSKGLYYLEITSGRSRKVFEMVLL